MGIFGGGDTKKTYTTTSITDTQDQRVMVGGSGAISAAPYSKVTANITSSGLKGAEVQQMLDTAFRESAATRESLTGLAGSLSSGLAAQGEQLASALTATRAPEQSALTALLPLALLAVLFLWSK